MIDREPNLKVRLAMWGTCRSVEGSNILLNSTVLRKTMSPANASLGSEHNHTIAGISMR